MVLCDPKKASFIWTLSKSGFDPPPPPSILDIHKVTSILDIIEVKHSPFHKKIPKFIQDEVIWAVVLEACQLQLDISKTEIFHRLRKRYELTINCSVNFFGIFLQFCTFQGIFGKFFTLLSIEW